MTKEELQAINEANEVEITMLENEIEEWNLRFDAELIKIKKRYEKEILETLENIKKGDLNLVEQALHYMLTIQ